MPGRQRRPPNGGAQERVRNEGIVTGSAGCWTVCLTASAGRNPRATFGNSAGLCRSDAAVRLHARPGDPLHGSADPGPRATRRAAGGDRDPLRRLSARRGSCTWPLGHPPARSGSLRGREAGRRRLPSLAGHTDDAAARRLLRLAGSAGRPVGPPRLLREHRGRGAEPQGRALLPRLPAAVRRSRRHLAGLGPVPRPRHPRQPGLLLGRPADRRADRQGAKAAREPTREGLWHFCHRPISSEAVEMDHRGFRPMPSF